MFQFPRLPPRALCVQVRGRPALAGRGSPIRVPAGRRVCAPHRGLSQLAAPFFGFLCQGIRRLPLTSSHAALPATRLDGGAYDTIPTPALPRGA